jgi:hypothetical protein
MKDFDPNLLKAKKNEIFEIEIPAIDSKIKFGLMNGQDYLDLTAVPPGEQTYYAIWMMVHKAYIELTYNDFKEWDLNVLIPIIDALGDKADFRAKA